MMNRLQESLPDEQFLQLIKDIKGSLNIKKTGLSETDYETAQEAKTQLLAIFTKIMMAKTGFVIDKSLEECGREVKDFKEENEYIKYTKEPSMQRRVNITN